MRIAYFGIKVDPTGAYDPTDTTPAFLRKFTAYGDYLPDVGDSLLFFIDLERTAKRTHRRVETVLSNLKALRSAGAKAWVDRFGATGFVLVRTADEASGDRVQGIESGQTASVSAELLEYS